MQNGVSFTEKNIASNDRPEASLQLKLRVKIVEHLSAAYWLQRGYEVVKKEQGPEGYWGAKKKFVLVTMV